MNKTESKEKQKQAISLKMQGFNQKEIAVKLGVSEQTISKWFKETIAEEIEKEKAKENRVKLFDLQIQKQLETPNPDILLIERWTKTKADYIKGCF